MTNATIVTGRVGELVDHANEATFKVVQQIFGYNGPYRKVLHKFGIGDLKDKNNFLLLIDGRVFTDIAIESAVLWKPCSYRLKLIDGKVITEFHFFGPTSLIRLFWKALQEILHVVFIDRHVKMVDRIYYDFSVEVLKVFQEETISMEKFLTLYESVVYVSYLYELMFNYNNSKGFKEKSPALKSYIAANDFLLSQNRTYAEFIYKLPQDFVFGNVDGIADIKPIHLEFIPSSVPDFKGVENKETRAEAKLQCIKDNLRLKTNVLLYFLNQTLYGGLSRNRTGV